MVDDPVTELQAGTATHVAGPIVSVQNRVIQRCCVCGEKLADNEDRAEEMRDFWSDGELVRIKDGVMYSVGRESQTIKKRLPSDFCIGLVER